MVSVWSSPLAVRGSSRREWACKVKTTTTNSLSRSFDVRGPFLRIRCIIRGLYKDMGGY